MFLANFLGTTEGQGFVIHIIQDGTLDPTEVRAYIPETLKLNVTKRRQRKAN